MRKNYKLFRVGCIPASAVDPESEFLLFEAGGSPNPHPLTGAKAPDLRRIFTPCVRIIKSPPATGHCDPQGNFSTLM